MLEKLLRTENDIAALILRLTIGIVFFPHGAQKVLGWFGGPGLSGTWGFMTGMLHIPAVFAALAIAAEFLGSLGLIAGLLGRVAAFGIACEMAVGAVIGGHLDNGFFMNWFGNQKGEGFEYHILVIGLAIAVMIKGSGACSLDRLLGRQRK